jgi:hypothetical protein
VKTRSDVFSWDLEDLSPSERFFHLAQAYVDSSRHLFKSLIDHSLVPATYSHAQAAAFLFEHSIELFLKGAIIQAGKGPAKTHYLEQLHNEFKNLYQGKQFEFEGKIQEAVKTDPQRPIGEYCRYPLNNSGELWPGNRHFTLEIWLEQVELFQKDFERLIPLVMDRYPHK